MTSRIGGFAIALGLSLAATASAQPPMAQPAPRPSRRRHSCPAYISDRIQALDRGRGRVGIAVRSIDEAGRRVEGRMTLPSRARKLWVAITALARSTASRFAR